MSDANAPALPRRAVGLRLQKHLAACGVGSRRHCEQLIADGRISVDGVVVREQGVRIDPDRQLVLVDGRSAAVEPPVYVLLHKPRGVICTAHDPQGRPLAQDLLPHLPARVFTAGRLDFDSEGLLLLTNDGDLVQRMMHPRHHVEKTYRVWIDRPLDAGDRRHLAAGIVLDGAPRPVDGLRLAFREAEALAPAWCYELRIREGRNRQIRRLMGALGRRVTRLQRIAIGPLRIGDLRPGDWRPLSDDEIARLREGVGLPRPPASRRPVRRGRSGR